MIMTGDNQGPPSLADVENLRRYAEKNLPGVRIHFGTLDDFARAVLAEKPALPVVRGDMPDTWIHGWLSMPIESRAAHTTRPLEPAVEALDTQLRAWGLTTGDLAPALAEAYEQSLLYSEHTFGPFGPNGGSWNSGTPRNLYGAAWKAAYARGAYKKYEQAFDDKLAYSPEGGRDRPPRASQPPRSVGQVRWRRPARASSSTTPCPGRVRARSRSPQPGEFLYAEDVPANGYKTFRPTARGNSARATTARGTRTTPHGQQTTRGTRGSKLPGTARHALLPRRVRPPPRWHRVLGREEDRARDGRWQQSLCWASSSTSDSATSRWLDYSRAYSRGYNFVRGDLPNYAEVCCADPAGVETRRRANWMPISPR